MNLVSSFFSLFFSYFFLFSTTPGQTQEPKIINKTPLSIDQVLVKKSQNKTSVDVTLELKLAKHHKAYADAFKLQFADEGITASEPAISPLEPFVDKFSNGRERLVFVNNGRLRARVNTPENLSGLLKAQLVYQACTKDYCLLPTKLPFKLNLPKRAPQSTPNASSSFSFSFESDRSLVLTLVLIYLFGFVTAFSPCVFPMIPITMGILGFSETSSRFKGFAIGFFYSLGLSLTYAVFGVLAAKTGGFIGQALTNSYVVWSIFLFYVVTAIAMLGVFPIKAPSFIENAFSKISGKGAWGAFLAGAVAGIVASPCVGPAVAAVVAYVAQSGDPVFGFAALFVYGMGLGTLFILLGVFYGEISSRLKPGKWLNYTKYLLSGLILIGAFLFIKPHLSFLSHGHDHKNSKQMGTWKSFSTRAYKEALRDQKFILIDFYADWCGACKELDEKTFSVPEFQPATQDMVLLKFDATKPTPEEQKSLNQFKVYGLPTLLFIDSTGKVREDLTLTGFEEWQDFKKRLQALKKQR